MKLDDLDCAGPADASIEAKRAKTMSDGTRTGIIAARDLKAEMDRKRQVGA